MSETICRIRAHARAWHVCVLFTVALGVRLLLSASHLSRIALDQIASERAPSGFLPPGEHYINSVLFAAVKSNTTAFSLVFALVGAALPLLSISLAKALLPGHRRAPVITGWIVALGFPFILLSTTWSPMLFPVLFGVLHVLAVVSVPDRPLRWMLGAGGTGALLLLTRPDYYLAGALVAACTRIGWRWRLGAIVGPVLVVSLHNLVAMGTVTATPGNLWYNLDAGNNPRAREAIIGDVQDRWHPELTMAAMPREDAIEHRHRVQEFLHDHPALALEGLVMKSARIFEVRRDRALSQGALENSSYTGFLLGLQILATIGLGMALVSGTVPVHKFLLLFLGYAIPMVVFFSLDRTRVLVQVLWAVYAALVFS